MSGPSLFVGALLFGTGVLRAFMVVWPEISRGRVPYADYLRCRLELASGCLLFLGSSVL